MLENQRIRAASVIGPVGEALTFETLPPPDTCRWTIRRKAEVIAAVTGGLITMNEACQRYGISPEEFIIWHRAVDRSGMQGLRVTRIQDYRELYSRGRVSAADHTDKRLNVDSWPQDKKKARQSGV